MLAFFGACWMSLVFMGGGLFVTNPVLGLILGGLGAALQGSLFAFVRLNGRQFVGTHEAGGLIVLDIETSLEQHNVPSWSKLYVGTPTGILRAGQMYTCQYQGAEAFVIEPVEETI